jgi:hypothetical protein
VQGDARQSPRGGVDVGGSRQGGGRRWLHRAQR